MPIKTRKLAPKDTKTRYVEKMLNYIRKIKERKARTRNSITLKSKTSSILRSSPYKTV